MLMLVSLYDLKSAENQLRGMRPRPRGPMSARMVKGKTIGIIGYGNISRAIIRRLTGWAARIVVSTRAPDERSPGVAFVGLDHLLEESDVVLMMTRLTHERNNLLQAQTHRKTKPGCLYPQPPPGQPVPGAHPQVDGVGSPDRRLDTRAGREQSGCRFCRARPTPGGERRRHHDDKPHARKQKPAGRRAAAQA